MAADANRPEPGVCQDCKQNRPLWPYDLPAHHHIDEEALRRCGCGNARPARVRVCVDCFGRRAGADEFRPADPADVTVLRWVAAQSGPEPAAPALEERRAS